MYLHPEQITQPIAEAAANNGNGHGGQGYPQFAPTVATPQLPNVQPPASTLQHAPQPRQNIQPEQAQMVPIQTQQPAASIEEIKAACPNAPADFILQMLEQNATMAAAQAAFIQHLQTRPTQPAAPSQPAAPPAAQYVPSQPPVQQAAPVQYVPAPGPGNQPVQAEPAFLQEAHQIQQQESAMGQWDQLVNAERDILTRAGLDPSNAARQAASSINARYPGLRERAFNIDTRYVPDNTRP